MKISEILHDAADYYLQSEWRNVETTRYSCVAVNMALSNRCSNGADFNKYHHIIMQGLKNMGCDVNSGTLFREYGDSVFNEDVQGMRYFWLKWAALMAEEQGV